MYRTNSPKKLTHARWALGGHNKLWETRAISENWRSKFNEHDAEYSRSSKAPQEFNNVEGLMERSTWRVYISEENFIVHIIVIQHCPSTKHKPHDNFQLTIHKARKSSTPLFANTWSTFQHNLEVSRRIHEVQGNTNKKNWTSPHSRSWMRDHKPHQAHFEITLLRHNNNPEFMSAHFLEKNFKQRTQSNQ